MMKDLIDLSLSFLKIGVSSLGGGNSMIELIEAECVHNHHWLSKGDFDLITSSSFVFPGLTAVKICGLIGYKVAGISGLLTSLLALNFPGLFLSVLLIQVLITYQNHPTIKNLIVYLKYGAVALLCAATYSLAQPLLLNSLQVKLIFYSIVFFVAVAFYKFSPFIGFFTFLAVCFIL